MATTATPNAPTKRTVQKAKMVRELVKKATRYNGYNEDSVARSQAKAGEKPSQFGGLWLKTRANE